MEMLLLAVKRSLVDVSVPSRRNPAREGAVDGKNLGPCPASSLSWRTGETTSS